MKKYFAGVDIGSTHCKVVIIDQNTKIQHQNVQKVKGNPLDTVDKMIKDARNDLKIRKKSLQVAKTGYFTQNLNENDYVMSELSCLAAGARFAAPNVRTVIDIGSFTNKVVLLNKSGKIIDYQKNDICSSGSGVFLELICKSLDIDLKQMSKWTKKSQNPANISSQCSIFAESEVIYLMNDGRKIEDIVKGSCLSIIGRIIPLITRLNPKQPMIVCGGVAKNEAIRILLEEQLEIEFLDFKLDPQFIVALGAAISQLLQLEEAN